MAENQSNQLTEITDIWLVWIWMQQQYEQKTKTATAATIKRTISLDILADFLWFTIEMLTISLYFSDLNRCWLCLCIYHNIYVYFNNFIRHGIHGVSMGLRTFSLPQPVKWTHTDMWGLRFCIVETRTIRYKNP